MTTAAALPDISKLDDASLYTLSVICSTVRNEIRKKDISLRGLKAINPERTLENPFDSTAFPLTPVIWALVMKCVTNRIEETCAGLLALEQRADGEYAAREVLAETPAAVTRSDRRTIEAEAAAAAANDTTPTKLEPAADIYRMTYPEIVEAIQMEKTQPCGTKPTARALLALMLAREERFLPPDVDSVRDVLQSQLVSAYLHGIITVSEWRTVNAIAIDAARPRELLRLLRESLLRGADIIDALKTAAAAE